MDIILDNIRWRCNNDSYRFQNCMELPKYFIEEEIDQIAIDPETNIARLHFKGGSYVRMAITKFHNIYSDLDRLEIEFVNKKGNKYHFAIFYNGRVAFADSILKGDDYDIHKQIKTFAYG